MSCHKRTIISESRIGPEHMIKVPHESKFKRTGVFHKVQKGP